MIKKFLHYFLAINLFLVVPYIYSYVPYKQVETTVGMKVNTYLSTIKDTIVTLPDGPRLISLLNRYAIVSLHKVTKLAHELSCASLPDTGITASQIRAAALMQLIVPIIDKFKRDVMNLITMLESSKKYWELKRERQSSIAMHVQQWMGKTNKKLNDKINILDAYLDQQFTNLGALTLHLDTFDATKNPDEQFAWMQQLCTIIIAAYPHAKLQPHEVSYEQVVPLVILASKCATHYPEAMHVRVKPYLMPNNFNKHLIRWSSALAAIGVGALSMYEKQAFIKEGAQQAGESVKTFGLEQQQRIKEAFFGNATKEKELQDKYKEVLDSLYNALTLKLNNENEEEKIVNTSNKEGKNALISMKSQSGKEEEIDDPLANTLLGLTPKERRDKFNLKNIAENAKNINGSFLDDIVVPLIFDLENLGIQNVSSSIKQFADKIKKTDTSIAKNFVGLSWEEMRDMALKLLWQKEKQKDEEKNVSKLQSQETQLIQDVIQAASDPMQKVSTVTDITSKLQVPNVGWLWWQVKVWNWNKQYRILLAILTTIPVYLVISEIGKGLYVLYKKLRGIISYDAIREALVGIATLLNIYKNALPSEMAIDDYGRLTYLIGLLKDPQIIQHVPHEYRSSFASNVQFLESSTLSAAEKLNMIDLMYKRYPFLMLDLRYTSHAKAA